VIGRSPTTADPCYGVSTAQHPAALSARPRKRSIASFNAGDYTRGVLQKKQSETLSKVLYQ